MANPNDPIYQSKLLDGLEAMHRNNDPGYAEAYNWYQRVYNPQPPVSYPTASPVYPSMDSLQPTFMDSIDNAASSVIQGGQGYTPLTSILSNALKSLDDYNTGGRMKWGLRQIPSRHEMRSGMSGVSDLQQGMADYEAGTIKPPAGFHKPRIGGRAPAGQVVYDDRSYAEAPAGILANQQQAMRGAADLAKLEQREMAELGPMDQAGLQAIMKSKGFTDTLSSMSENPRAAFEVFGRSMGYSAPALGASILAGVIAPGVAWGALASGATAGIGSYLTEFTVGAQEIFGELGVDISNPAAMDALLNDPEKLKAGLEALKTKSSTIALFDMIGAGASLGLGKLAAKAATLPRKLGAGAAALPIEGATEFGGEYYGTKLATGHENIPAAVMEGVLGFAGGAVFAVPGFVSETIRSAEATPEYLKRVLEKALAKREILNDETVLILEGAIDTLENPSLTEEQFNQLLTALRNKDSAGAFAAPRGDPELFGATAVFHIDSILADLQATAGKRKVTRAEAKAKALELVGHEIEIHVALRKAIAALGLNAEEIDNFYNNLDKNNSEAIDTWLKGAGVNYAGDARQTQVEEWIANEVKRRTQEGGRFVRFLRKFFKDKSGLDLSTVDVTTLVQKLGRQARGEAMPLQPIERPVEVVPDTSKADLDAARAERQVQETILDEQTSSLERSTLGDPSFAKRVDIDNRRQTAINKAMAPNKHIRESDLRMNAIKENWEDNKDDLSFRRDYANFNAFEQAEWDLNYDMWIDEVQAEEANLEQERSQLDTSKTELAAVRAERAAVEAEIDATVEEIEETTIEQVRTAGRLPPLFAKRVAEMDEAEKLNRDVRYDFARGPYKEIVGREDEAEIRARIKRLGNLYGPMGQKRGIEPGDRATAKEQAQNAIDNVEAFEEFMAPFEEQMQTQPAVSKTATGRQKKYAERKGITIADILKYRERGKIHPMERKMSYAFANEEIDRLEAEGTITAKEAEARRVKLREFQSELQGRMPPGAKRKVTEIVFGIGDYANIETWEFTEEQTQKMEERAELAKAKERKTGTRRAVPTEQQAGVITAKEETTEETNILNDMEASIEENMIDYDVNTGEPKYTTWQKLVISLKDRAGRLRWLREEEQVSTEERDMLDAFKKDPKTFDQETVQAQRDVRQPVDETKVTRVEQTPAQRKAELKEMKEAQTPIEKRKHIQVEPDFFETLEDPLFTIQGESIPEGFIELTEDGVLEEVEESDALYSKPLKETKTRNEAVLTYIRAFMRMVTDPIKRSSDRVRILRNIESLVEINILEEEGEITSRQAEDRRSETPKEIAQALGLPHKKRSIIDAILSLTLEDFSVLVGFFEDRLGTTWRGKVTKFLSKKLESEGTRREMSQETVDMLLEHKIFGSKTTEDGKTTYDFFNVHSVTGLFQPIFKQFQLYSRQLYKLLGEKNVARREAGLTPYNPGNKINREALETESPSMLNIDEIMSTRTNLNEASGGKNYYMDHVRELVTERMIQKLYEGARRFSAHVATNLAVMYKPIHDMKSMFVAKYPQMQDSARPYTAMLKFMKGDVGWLSGVAPNTKESGEFIKHWTDKWKISEDELIKKVEDYLDTVKKGAENDKVVEATVRAAAAWEGNETVEALLLSVAQQEDSILAGNPKLKENIENTIALFAKKTSSDPVVMEEHFNNNFWYVLTSYLWGKPVQAIRDFNKLSRFGRRKADIPEADVIADNIQRAHASGQRAEGLKYGTDLMQDTSMKLGEYFTKLYQIFSYATGRLGDLNKRVNKVLVNYITDNISLEEIDNVDLRESAKMLKEFIQGIYDYAKEQTKHLKNPLNLRGHGDTLLPRVWNIEYLATRIGKAKFIRVIRAAISDPATGSSILEDTDLTIEDLYDVVVNSGGFVQGDWTNLKADQTRSAKDVERDQRAQEHLDSLPTQVLVEAGLVLDDLQAIMPRFVQKAVERVEYAKRFGVNDEILREMIDKALAQIKEHNAKVLKLSKEHQELSWIDPKRFVKAVWDMARILRNKFGYDLANMSTRAFLQRLSNFQVIVKLPLVTLASMPELFTPMLRGDVRFDKWIVDFMMGLAWAGYKGMNGLSKLILNKHLPAMRKKSADIGGIGVVSNAQLLRELGVYEIQSMGDMVSTRYANPNFARGGLRAGARGTIAGKVPKKIRAIFNMQTYMQAVLLTTLTEMQQLMALRNFQRVVIKRIKFIFKNRGKKLTGRKARLYKQFVQDLADYGITEDIDLDTAAGEAAANAGAIRFVDQVITRPNDATTAKAFKNPLTAPIFLFKRFITTFGNTLMTAVGNDFASKVDNVERAKQAGKLIATMTAMYGAVMFAEVIRGAIKGDLDDDDMTITGGDFRTFVRRVDRTGLLSAPGAMIVNLAFPYKRGWWDSPEARIFGEFGGPIGGDLAALMKTALDGKPGAWKKLVRQIVPMSKQLIDLPPKKKRSTRPSSSIYGGSTRRKKNRASIY